MSAKEMFKKLDFYKISEKPIIYRHDDGGCITEYLFNPIFHSLQVKEWEEYNDKKPQGSTTMYVKHIQAITKQMKELGWLDVKN